jgi:hypothetical protein
MGHIRTHAARQAAPPKRDQKIQEKRLRIAQSIVRALREAGYTSEMADDGPAPSRPSKCEMP